MYPVVFFELPEKLAFSAMLDIASLNMTVRVKASIKAL